MLEVRASKPAVVAVQLGAVWAVGAIALPTLWHWLPIALYAGWTGVVGLAVVAALAVHAYLIMVIAATGHVSILGATANRRVLWALLVLSGGAVGWILGWVATDAAGLGVSRNAALTFLLGGVPFALVAALFLRGWLFSIAAAGLSLVLIGTGVVVLRQEPPDDLEARLTAAGVHRETAYAVVIPGYVPAGDRDYGNGRGGGTFSPENPGAVPPDRYITITAHDRVSSSEPTCGQPAAQDSLLSWGSCAVEADGLVYRHTELLHGYQERIDREYVTVVGTAAVDHDLLRAAAKSLHVATAAELGGVQQTGDYYAATVPGYVGQVTGPSPGMVYEPADHTGNGAQSVFIMLSVSYGDRDDICFPPTTCTPDHAGLTYLRREDTHGYARQRGQLYVEVDGGLRVDKALLRQAALDARPATADELRRVLPPATPHGTVDRFRQWLRKF